MNDRFETELKNALRPVDPGPDFLDGVMRQLQAQEPTVHASDRSQPPLRGVRPRWLAVGLAASLVAAVGIVQIRAQREEAEGLRARDQVFAALHVTSEKLNLAYRVVQEQPGIDVESDVR